MNQDTPKDNQAARISYLEESRRFTRNSLEIALSLGDFQKQIHKQASHEQIFSETQARISRLIDFDVTAFYLVDQETSDLSLSLCTPPDQAPFVEDQTAFLIDNGFMAWGLREPRGVTFPSGDREYVIFLHVIATYSRIRGVFLGIFSGQEKSRDISYDLTSIVLRSAANALESVEYYSLLDRQGMQLKKARDELELRVEKRTAELTAANERLQKEVEERKKAEQNKAILLKEIHHRVKNNMQIILSLIKMQSRQMDQPEFIRAFKDSQDRIYSMALVHEQLYQSENFSRIDFRLYVKKLVRNLRGSFDTGQRTIHIRVAVKDVFMDIDHAIPCGLVINELVTNAFKHAFSGRDQGEIRVNMHPLPETGQVELLVEDDGIGMPQAPQGNTLGTKLVDNLVRYQLSGSIRVDQENGTSCRIRFFNPLED